MLRNTLKNSIHSGVRAEKEKSLSTSSTHCSELAGWSWAVEPKRMRRPIVILVVTKELSRCRIVRNNWVKSCVRLTCISEPQESRTEGYHRSFRACCSHSHGDGRILRSLTGWSLRRDGSGERMYVYHGCLLVLGWVEIASRIGASGSVSVASIVPMINENG